MGRNIRQKKKFLLVLLVIACITALYGCGDDTDKRAGTDSGTPIVDEDGFIAVYKLQYLQTILFSKAYLKYESNVDIGESDYSSFDGPRLGSLQDYGLLINSSVEITISRDKSNIEFSENLKIGDYFAYSVMAYSEQHWRKSQVAEIIYDYVFVKVVDSRTIIIRTNDGISEVATDYYQIDYFN
jgi:hypothetical protein